jgi:HAD superfamily hydrolase (TIGR01509 family)
MIRHVVFDVGWVFFDLDPRPLLELLAARGSGPLELAEVVTRIGLEDHETGRLAGPQLLANIASLTAARLDAAEAHAAWIDMFELQPSMVELARRLAQRYRVHLLSNIGELHWAYLCERYELHSIGHGALPSFLAGVLKPHAGIYAEAERRFSLEPAATVFIDDRADNIEAARARGWHGIVHRSYPATRDALAELGVSVD